MIFGFLLLSEFALAGKISFIFFLYELFIDVHHAARVMQRVSFSRLPDPRYWEV